MGVRDSSKTRVKPVFDQLYAIDPTGLSWLGKLISLPSDGSPVSLPTNCDLRILDPQRWGEREKRLDPPVALLSWLIRHPRSPVSGELSSDPEKLRKRKEWLAGSEAAITEALSLLRDNPKGEDWHLFEGQTQPDVFVETRDVIVVIEGKRTERGPTTSTKWMPVRHQMLRHIDCAWEIAAGRKVIGFFIVEGSNEGGAVPAEWMEYSKRTVDPDIVAPSLPHRGPEEQSGIASSFAGVTTWQRVCEEFNLSWAALLDCTT